MNKKSFNSFWACGTLFGDEGKGVVTNSLSHQYPNSLVVRYSGGQQAGHTVVHNGISHVFSNFGSGTMQGLPTYWSEYCTFDPVGVMVEYHILKQKGFNPKLYISKNSPVTTPFDKFNNQRDSRNLDHGTCGAGVGATFAREEKFQSLLAGDLLYPLIFTEKYNNVKKYYNFIDWTIDPEAKFEQAVIEILSNPDVFCFVDALSEIPEVFDKYIFEGSQGLMLDQNIGFFPNVTRSNTGSKNILGLGFAPKPILITRAFQTRHGNGYMTNENIPHNITDNPLETNVLNKYQGKFRKSLLDLSLIKYAISRDNYLRRNKDKELVVTCLDLIKNEYRYTINGEIIAHSDEDSFISGIKKYLDIEVVHRVHCPSALLDIK